MAWSKDNGRLAAEAANEALIQAQRAEVSADYIDAKQPLIDEFTGEQTNLQTQLNDLVLQNGTDIAEVVQARGGEVTLNTRLDKTTAQLAEKVDLDVYKSQWVNVNEYTTIEDAITEATNRKVSGQTPILWFSPRISHYETNATVTIPTGINVVMDSPLIYAGTANETALIIGAKGIANINVKLVIKVRRKTQSDWLNENNIGVVIYNANASKIYIAEASGFTIGFQAMGSSGGFSYNNVQLGLMMNNKFSVDLTNETSTSGAGWCNENSYFAGRFGNSSGVGTGLSRYGVRITSKDGTYVGNNNNIFYKPSFELAKTVATPNEALPILIEHGSYNRFYDCRDEANSVTLVRVLNASESNFVEIGYTALTTTIKCLEDLSIKRNTIINLPHTKIFNEGHVIFNSGNLVNKACYYDGNTNVNIAGVAVTSSGNNTPQKFVPSTTTIINSNDVTFLVGRGVGITIKTKRSKRFVVKKDVDTGYGGRTVLRCYDIAGNLITTGTPVKGNITFSYSTSYGGSYSTNADSEVDVFINLDESVCEIHIFIIEGTTDLKIRGFEVISLDGYTPASVGYEEISQGANLGIAPPTSGTWSVGRRVVNNVPTVGQPKAWICTASGTPGTWVSEGNL